MGSAVNREKPLSEVLLCACLYLLHGIMLVHGCLPAPDAAACCPDFYGIGIFPETSAHGFAEIPRAIHTLSPGMGRFIHLYRQLMGVSMAACSAKTPSPEATTLGPLTHPVPLSYSGYGCRTWISLQPLSNLSPDIHETVVPPLQSSVYCPPAPSHCHCL